MNTTFGIDSNNRCPSPSNGFKIEEPSTIEREDSYLLALVDTLHDYVIKYLGSHDRQYMRKFDSDIKPLLEYDWETSTNEELRTQVKRLFSTSFTRIKGSKRRLHQETSKILSTHWRKLQNNGLIQPHKITHTYIDEAHHVGNARVIAHIILFKGRCRSFHDNMQKKVRH